jgi:hypothetical protein
MLTSTTSILTVMAQILEHLGREVRLLHGGPDALRQPLFDVKRRTAGSQVVKMQQGVPLFQVQSATEKERVQQAAEDLAAVLVEVLLKSLFRLVLLLYVYVYVPSIPSAVCVCVCSV